MRRRVLAACLWAYPRELRERDGAALRDLAEELAGDNGLLREALGLVRGGVARRRRASVAATAAVAVVLALLTGSAAAAGGLQVEVEELSAPSGAASPDPERPDVFDASDLPAGSSGTLVAGVDGEMLVCEGWGLADRRTGQRAGCDTVYDIGSMTKQFTAAAVLKLQMMGRLQVGDRIGRFLRHVPADKRAITVQQLLTHSSGLVEGLGDDYDPISRAGLVERALASDLRSTPGERHHYSNLGYSLLAAIVEIASGQGYEEFLDRRLFRPARMTSTGYLLPGWDRADVAVEYDGKGRSHGRPYEHPWAADGPYWNLRGNGGLLSTARDMFRWSRALADDVVLDARSRRAMFRPRIEEGPHADSRYAYGWVVLDSRYGPVQWHNGGNGWSYGEVARVPDEGAFLFWVTNRSHSRRDGWSLERRAGRITGEVIERLSKIDRARGGGSTPD